ncbi:MAG TPA: hypothetical protein PKJ68_06035 [Candidatus Woesebacteria bacterium]|nr:hypothetical protein [Candidatus Woesebacteria bacterium]
MIHLIVEIVEKEADEGNFEMNIEAFIKGDGTSTDYEFRMAKTFMKQVEKTMTKVKEAAEKTNGLEMTKFSLGGKSLKPESEE